MKSRAPIDLTFERPTRSRRSAFADWLADWRGDPYDPYQWIFVRAWHDFDWYVELCDRMRREGCRPQLRVPLDVRWAFRADELVGELYLFYDPMLGDNHIGYKVRPSCRRRGIASALLDEGLHRLHRRGIVEARLTCADTNLGSATVIERAGGIRLDDKLGSKGQLMRRYAVPFARPSYVCTSIACEGERRT